MNLDHLDHDASITHSLNPGMPSGTQGLIVHQRNRWIYSGQGFVGSFDTVIPLILIQIIPSIKRTLRLPLYLLSRSSLEPLISLDLVGTKLYCFRVRVHCYHCLYIIFSTNPVRRSEELRGGPLISWHLGDFVKSKRVDPRWWVKWHHSTPYDAKTNKNGSNL